MSNSILLAPGPVQLHPEVQKILSMPMIHHRTPEFDGILKSVLQKLKYLFQTEQPVLMQSSTGSGGMESLLINVMNPGDKILCIVSGKFGERWADMAEHFGGNVHRLNVNWGESVSVDAVTDFLKNNPDTAIVMTQACETSTATAHDIQKLAAIISQTPALFLVDGITALGAYPLPMDEWKIDGLVAGSQKAVMLPTGMSFISYSARAWKKVETCKSQRFYFDLRKEFAANKKGETYFSSNVPLIRALDFVLTRIQEIGIDRHFQQLHRRQQYTLAMAKYLQLEIYSKSPSRSVTALKVPVGMDGTALREHLEKKYELTVMGGQDQLKGLILRLGHMGYITDQHLHQTTERLAKGLIDFKIALNLEKVLQQSEIWLKENPPL